MANHYVYVDHEQLKGAVDSARIKLGGGTIYIYSKECGYICHYAL